MKNDEINQDVIKVMVDEIPKRRIFFHPNINADSCSKEYFRRTGKRISWNWLVKEAILKEISRRLVKRDIIHYLEHQIAGGEIYIGKKQKC